MDRKLAFIVVSTALSIVLFLRNGFEMAGLTISQIQRTGAYPYAVLGLCLLMLYSKRGVVAAAAEKNNVDLSYSFAGMVLIILSILTPVGEPATQAFAALLLWLGAFTIFYGAAAVLPMALLAIYGFALVLPGFITGLGNGFPLATTIVLTRLLQPFIPISHLGQTIKFTDVSGGGQSYYVDAACSGSAALTVFLSLFLLMFIDRPLPKARALQMLIFGIMGTLLQNIARLSVLVLAGYLYGSEALWTMHLYAGYILFIMWYAVFAYVYFKVERTKGINNVSKKTLQAA